jgi:uncharacterized protein (DUF362 family)
LKEQEVAVLKENLFEYPLPPSNPSEIYPELCTLPYKIETSSKNAAHGMVRRLLSLCSLDKANYGTKRWNPLSDLVQKNGTVVIKPNLVRDTHPMGQKAVLSTVTNASILRPIIDYTIIALEGKGQIAICDAPLQITNIDCVCKINGLNKLLEFYASQKLDIKISLIDLRKRALVKDNHTKKEQPKELKGDPLGYSIINLGQDSIHTEIQKDWKKYFVTGYDPKTLRKYQTDKKHCYLISNTLLSADLIISIPKLKTHKKAGITVALKNFVGINGCKDFLPHHRMGDPKNGGDQYPSPPDPLCRITHGIDRCAQVPKLTHTTPFNIGKHLSNQIVQRDYIEGNWHGNDTLWRTVVDLNMAIRFSDKQGKLCETPQRKFLFLVDGIVGQEKFGPMHGPPKKCGVLIGGINPCAVDYVAAKLMGFNYKYLRQIAVPFSRRNKMKYPLVDFGEEEIKVSSNEPTYIKIQELKRADSLKFCASIRWEHMEGD